MNIKQINTILVLLILALNDDKQSDLIYILQWTGSKNTWVKITKNTYLETGQEPFVKRNCLFKNCFLTYNRSFFDDILDFDVLLFNAVHLSQYFSDMPPNRSEVQQYVLVGFEPAGYYPLPPVYNLFFNITWTYKLTSDVVQSYILVKNKQGQFIGPRKNMHWVHQVEDMAPIGKDIKSKLRHKTIAAAWIVSNCEAISRRWKFVTKLQKELLKYDNQVDIYGKCGNLICKNGMEENGDLITGCADKI